jgi:hypothetical protein
MAIIRRDRERPRANEAAMPRRRSTFRKVLSGIGWLAASPGDWAGAKRLARGASLIGGLAGAMHMRLQRDPRFKVGEAGSFDLVATAFSYGMTVPQLEACLATRRKDTARIAYATFALAGMFLLAWVRAALSSPWTISRMVLGVEFLPFCMLFFLIAFYNALLNFQIRMRRLVNWREYLLTNESFWPR